MQLSAKGADAEVTKDSIVEALGYEPEKAEGKFELIETITVEEDAVIERTATSDGRAYEFRDMFITASIDSVVQTFGFYFYGTSVCGFAYFPSLSTSAKRAAIRCHAQNGYWWSEQHNAGGAVTLGAARLSGEEYNLRFEQDQKYRRYINRIVSQTIVKAGITLKIYAIWA